MTTKGQWTEDGQFVCYVRGDVVFFRDTPDHWRNGLCRLLAASEADVRRWVEGVAGLAHGRPLTEVEPEVGLATLAAGARSVFPEAPKTAQIAALEQQADPRQHVWASAVAEDQTIAVVGPERPAHGRLVDSSDFRPLGVQIEYEDSYFESGGDGTGYDGYRAQSTWRLEKGARQVRQLLGISDVIGAQIPSAPSILDIGSGYGFFRRAAADHGWTTFGYDVSVHAQTVAREMFDLDTLGGDLGDLRATLPAVNVITMWDFIEHVSEPEDVLRATLPLLEPDGILLIRTPNLLAGERDVFGSRYHSFKREHLHFFSPGSLSRTLTAAGYEPAFLISEAHLLRGFLGPGTSILAASLQGSDLLVAARPVAS